MANADYTARNLGLPFCPSARLAAPIGPLDTTATMTGYTSPIAEGIRIGMAAMVGGEIVVVEARSGNTLTLGRGTCDTIPAPHAANTPIFFFDDSVGSDDRQYVAGESIAVKPLPRTTSGGPLSIEASPPVGLTFNWRFNRPYPPGNVRVNGQPFTSVVSLGLSTGPLTLTWAHRDRIVQMDQLVKHGEASIGPEAGTTYRVRVIRASDGSVRRTADLGAVTTWSYTFAEFVADFGPSASSIPAILTLESRRDGLSSWQSYSIAFVGLSSIVSDSDTLDVGFPVAATGFTALDVSFGVQSSGSSTLDVGYEVASVVVSDPVIGRFNGTNNQTTGVANDGSIAGNFSIADGASLSTTTPYSGATALRYPLNSAPASFLTFAPTALTYTTNTPFSFEFRFLVPVDAEIGAGGIYIFAGILANVAGDNALMPRVEISPRSRPGNTLSVLFRATAALNQVVDYGSLPAHLTLSKGAYIHVAMSWDGAKYRAFVNGSFVGEFTPSALAAGNTRRMRLQFFGGGSQFETPAGLVCFVDNLRLRYGFAYTESFTPDAEV